tara:strand:- start:3940 stop:4101 length:162 start_codon:yes stop_codon:yes gene_type:complete
MEIIMNIKTKEKIILLWQEYQAIMANAWQGDEQKILDQIEALGGLHMEDEANA